MLLLLLLLLLLLVFVNAVAVAVSVAVQDSEETLKCAFCGALPRSAFSDMQIRHMSKSDRRVLSVSSVSDSAYCVTGERRHCGQTDIDRRDGLGGPPKRMMTKVEAACFCIGWIPFVAIRAKPTLIVVTAMSPAASILKKLPRSRQRPWGADVAMAKQWQCPWIWPCSWAKYGIVHV